MSEQNPTPENGQPPAANIRRGRQISAVWIIPLIAVLIGGWLVYKTVSEQGPEITLTFETATGLEAGKTEVKYKDVTVGTIERVELDPDTRNVVAAAEMKTSAESLLTDTARFWVVRPRVGIKGISGLDTLVSGAFVELDPGKGGEAQREFTALEDPPMVKGDTPGTEIILVSPQLGSLADGSPVYFRGIEAGEVLGYELAEDNSKVLVHAFIHAPYNRLVRKSSRFWNVSGVGLSLGAGGVKVEASTLQSLILGGIEFETPDLASAGKPVEEKTEFILFDSQEDIQQEAFTEKVKFILYFNSSVRGLNVGAPVEFRGIKVGSVLDIRLEFDTRTGDAYVPVLIDFELGRISPFDRDLIGPQLPFGKRRENLEQAVERGLRARLKTGNFLTGQLIVDLDMYPDTPVTLAGRGGDYLEIPTLPAQMEEISNSVTELVAKLQRLPLDTISEKLVSTLDGADKLINSGDLKVALTSLREASENLNKLTAEADRALVPEATATLKKAEEAMASAERVFSSVDSMVSEKSALRYEVQGAVREIAEAARALRQLAEFLQRNPNALLTGKSPQ